jgi:phosphatidylglycerol:prolipoprotein diacylglycerol transferase
LPLFANNLHFDRFSILILVNFGIERGKTVLYPTLIDFGLFRISTYVVCLFLAILLIAYVSGREARRLGLPAARFYDMAFFMSIAALAGSYLLYVALHYQTYLADPWRFLNFFKGGLVYYGGLLGALAVACFYPGRHGFSWRVGMDALAVGLPLGLAMGRIGCFSAGCCYGRYSNLPWAVNYPLRRFGVTLPLHPAQLYESFLLLVVFAVVYALRRRKRFDGQTMLTYLFLANWVRFGVEFFRAPTDYRGPVYWGMPLTQIIALFLVLASGTLWWWGWRQATGKAAAKLTA